MAATLRLPQADGNTAILRLEPPPELRTGASLPASRVPYAAVHVVADPRAVNGPGAPARLDWEATLSCRRYLWSLGLGVAEAMDTAQRGMGLDWACAAELIRRSAAEARAVGGLIAAGAGTDHAPPDLAGTDRVAAAYEEQLAVVADAGVTPILMASRQLARSARGPDDYATVYGRLLAQVDRPAILHWLGPMFDPALEGYWGSKDLDQATESFLAVVRDHADRVDGVKVSLLDADHEVRLRSQLPTGVRLYTGDDFNYPGLIRSGSDALLGIFDAIAPAASAAFVALDRGDEESYDAILGSTVPLSRHLFGAPTYHYKTGICFLAWVTGRQPAFTMVGGQQSARSVPHLAEAFRLAAAAGLVPDPDLAAARMRSYLAVHGFDA